MGTAKFSKKMECKPNDVKYDPVVHKMPKKEETPAQIQIELDDGFLYRQKIEEKRKEKEEESRIVVIDLI